MGLVFLFLFCFGAARISPLFKGGDALFLSSFRQEIGCSFFVTTVAVGSLARNRELITVAYVSNLMQNPPPVSVVGAAVFLVGKTSFAILAANDCSLSVSSADSCSSIFILRPDLFVTLPNCSFLGLARSDSSKATFVSTTSIVEIGLVEGTSGKVPGVTKIINLTTNGSTVLGAADGANGSKVVLTESELNVISKAGRSSQSQLLEDDYPSESLLNGNSISSFSLGYVPFGASSDWGATLIGIHDLDGRYPVVIGLFQDQSCGVSWLGDTGTASDGVRFGVISPKSYLSLQGQVVAAVVTQQTEIYPTYIQVIGIGLYNSSTGGVAPTPMCSPLDAVRIALDSLPDGCLLAKNPFAFIEDDQNSNGSTYSILLQCSSGPAVLDTPNLNLLGGVITFNSVTSSNCSVFGNVCNSCNVLVQLDGETLRINTFTNCSSK